MKKILTALLVCGMFMPLVVGVNAQEKKGKSPEEQFKSLDKDSDGKLSKAEFVARITDPEKKTKAETRFSRIDKNNDGFLSLEEYKEGTMKKKK
jgi:Ca2+-binding EF-hand superfamily protein